VILSNEISILRGNNIVEVLLVITLSTQRGRWILRVNLRLILGNSGELEALDEVGAEYRYSSFLTRMLYFSIFLASMRSMGHLLAIY
jgi:hypothetical protein